MNTFENGLSELLRDAYPGRNCPPPEQWLDWHAGELEPARAAWMNNHASGCAACAAERDLSKEFTSDASDDVLAEDLEFVIDKMRERPPPRSGRGNVVSLLGHRARVLQPLLGLAAAAALVLAVLPVIGPMVAQAPTLPAPAAHTVTRGTVIEALNPMGDLDSMPEELRWETYAGAETFRATIRTVDNGVLWQDTVRSSDKIAVPDSARAKMHAAVVYTWQVEALNAGGSRLAASEPASFRTLPGAQK